MSKLRIPPVGGGSRSTDVKNTGVQFHESAERRSQTCRSEHEQIAWKVLHVPNWISYSRLEAIAIRLEAIAIRLEAIAIRLEGTCSLTDEHRGHEVTVTGRTSSGASETAMCVELPEGECGRMWKTPTPGVFCLPREEEPKDLQNLYSCR